MRDDVAIALQVTTIRLADDLHQNRRFGAFCKSIGVFC